MKGVPRRKPLLNTNNTYAHLISAKIWENTVLRCFGVTINRPGHSC